MRKGYSGTLVLLDEAGLTVGVASGSDATTEHDMGTAALQSKLGCRAGSDVDVQERLITRLPREFGAQTLPDGSFLLSSNLEAAKGFLKSELNFRDSPDALDLVGAWDSRDFAFRGRNAVIASLVEIAEALPRHEVLLGGLLARHPRYWQAGGLVLALISRIPQELVDIEQQAVNSRRRLLAAAAEIQPGLERTLAVNGKRFFALSPRWADDSESEVVFWLNPWDQHIYNSGQYTVGQLLEWAEGKGPVVKGRAA